MSAADRDGVAVPPQGGQDLPSSTGALGMRLFLIALGMLFGATLLGYLVIRSRAAAWPPPGAPSLPLSLVFSTIVILTSSWTAQGALMAARAQRHDVLRKGLLLTFVLGLVFCISQTVGWIEIYPAVSRMGLRQPAVPGALMADHSPRQFVFLFYTLTALHAVHVLGGLVAFALARFGNLDFRTPLVALGRVRHAVAYWHFLAAVWVVMYVVMLI